MEDGAAVSADRGAAEVVSEVRSYIGRMKRPALRGRPFSLSGSTRMIEQAELMAKMPRYPVHFFFGILPTIGDLEQQSRNPTRRRGSETLGRAGRNMT